MNLPDWGPVYTETNLSQFPVEPWNTFTNLLFLAIALYWWNRREKLESAEFRRFLKITLPLLLIGYVGGTLYHATRAHVVWMLMDVGPIYILGFITAIYHWRLLKISWVKIFLIYFGCFVIPNIVLWSLDISNMQRQTLGYLTLAVPCALPILWHVKVQKYVHLKSVIIPLLLIGCALIARSLDAHPMVQQVLPMGTHWVWHSLGALTCHFLLLHMEVSSHSMSS